MLEWFKNSGFHFKYSTEATHLASECGHIHVLEWLKNSGFEFKYTESVTDCALKNGNVEVLEWLKNSGFEFKHTRKGPIYWTSPDAAPKTMHWLKNSGVEYEYDTRTHILKLNIHWHHKSNTKKLPHKNNKPIQKNLS